MLRETEPDGAEAWGRLGPNLQTLLRVTAVRDPGKVSGKVAPWPGLAHLASLDQTNPPSPIGPFGDIPPPCVARIRQGRRP
jgi:hypothetical protein